MGQEKQSNRLSFFTVLSLIVVLTSLLPIYFPFTFWNMIMLADWIHPFMHHSPWVNAYHSYLLSKLPEREELPIPEISLELLSRESLFEVTKGYVQPVLIRGALKDTQAVKMWSNRTWWLENYGDETVLCNYLKGNTKDSPPCKIRDAFGYLPDNFNGSRMYIEGESKLFVDKPELLEMLNSDVVNSVIPGKRVFTQMFGGFPGMGSDVHAAIGVNVFHMIAGKKKWWLFPHSQAPYLFSSVNPWDHFSAWTKTRIGKHDEEPSPWISKLHRYSSVLEPGDLLISTAWTWHGVLNVGDEKSEDVIIGVPMRFTPLNYGLPAFQQNWMLSIISLIEVTRKHFTLPTFMYGFTNLQDGIIRARNIRKQQELEKMKLQSK